MITLEDSTPLTNLPNWEQVQNLIEKSKNSKLQVAHKTVYTRLSFAKFHLSILRQAENNEIKRAMFEDVVINLVSSLQALAHFINELYEIGIKEYQVSIDHLYINNEDKHKKATKKCLRCKLKDYNENIAYALDEVLKTGSPTNNWYHALIEYRHQIVHRQHYIAHIEAGDRGYYLPDDPNDLEPKGKSYYDKEKRHTVWANYTKRREIKRFTEKVYNVIVSIINSIYELISIDIRTR